MCGKLYILCPWKYFASNMSYHLPVGYSCHIFNTQGPEPFGWQAHTSPEIDINDLYSDLIIRGHNTAPGIGLKIKVTIVQNYNIFRDILRSTLEQG